MGLTKEERAAAGILSPCGKKSMCLAGIYPDRPYAPELVTARALEWMAQQSEPFYVRISYLQPHTPVIVKQGYEKVYKDYLSGRSAIVWI